MYCFSSNPNDSCFKKNLIKYSIEACEKLSLRPREIVYLPVLPTFTPSIPRQLNLQTIVKDMDLLKESIRLAAIRSSSSGDPSVNSNDIPLYALNIIFSKPKGKMYTRMEEKTTLFHQPRYFLFDSKEEGGKNEYFFYRSFMHKLSSMRIPLYDSGSSGNYYFVLLEPMTSVCDLLLTLKDENEIKSLLRSLLQVMHLINNE